jgi:hypothetical protein
LVLKDNDDKLSINEEIERLRENGKYFVNKSSNTIIISSSKYYEWFYGKTILSNDSNEYKIEGAICVIKKHFPMFLENK